MSDSCGRGAAAQGEESRPTESDSCGRGATAQGEESRSTEDMGRPNNEHVAYMAQKRLDVLFQSFMVGIINSRPDDPVAYLEACVGHIKEHELKPDDIIWDTFLAVNTNDQFPAANRLKPITPQPMSADASEDDLNPGKRMIRTMDVTSRHCENTTKYQNVRKKEGVGDDRQELAKKEHVRRHRYIPQASLIDSITHDNAPEEDDQDQQPDDDVDPDPAEDSDPLALLGPQARSILQGHWDDLPPMPSNIVRIFLSSTFSDFKAERNYLPRHAYPAIREYCLQKGLDFQVVDMRWGVTDEVANDHKVSQLCLDEVRRCQQISKGPTFVAMLGNRYGYQPFPSAISADEFQHLINISQELQLRNRELLCEWFYRDNNALKPEYILQPITSSTQGQSKSESSTGNQVQWDHIKEEIQLILRACASTAFDRGLITSKENAKYFQSVTEEEIRQGLFHDEAPDRHTICFVRNLEGLATLTENPLTRKYLDVIDGSPDALAQERLYQLTEKAIPEVLPPGRLRKFNLPWFGESLESSRHETHLQYLRKFANEFVDRMVELIDDAYITDDDDDLEILRQLYNEVIHHAKFAEIKTEIFHGRDAETAAIKSYLTGQMGGQHAPLVVVANSGFGKTAFMASIATKARCLLEDTSLNVVLRFLGTSPSSSDIIQTLQSIVSQIYHIYRWPYVPMNKLKTYGDCRRVLWSTLEKVSQSRKQSPLLIILDAVDQLVDNNNVFSMTWVPRYLPPNVFFVLSMLPNKYDCLINTKQRIDNAENYIELSTLDDTNALQIIESSLDKAERRLTKGQTEYIFTAFKKCKQPLFLKMIMDSALTWHSYDVIDNVIMAQSVGEAINALFDSVEVQFGKLFVQHALGYLTAGNGGLTSVEMEDALSCDDIVLNVVYRYHDPPLDDVIRIPSLMWSRVQNALAVYLAERQVDGKTVYTWYHRQFWEAAGERYLADLEERQFIHSTLADVYIQESGIKRTIVLENRNDRLMDNADRCIARQPLTPKNLRKLSALPRHLYEAGRTDELKRTCLYDFKWILTSLVAYDPYKIVKDYKSYAALLPDSDETLQLITDFLLLVLDELSTDPLLLAFHVIERLDEFTGSWPSICKLHNDATEWIHSTPYPVLVPTHSLDMIKLKKTNLKSKLLLGASGKLTKSENVLLCNQVEKLSGYTKFNILNLDFNEVLASFPSHKATFYEIMNDNKRFVYVDYFELKINELLSGDRLSIIRFEPEKYEKITTRCMAISSDDIYVLVGAKLGRPLDNQDDDLRWRSQSVIYLVKVMGSRKVTKIPFRSGKGIDNAHFILQNNAILVTNRSKMTILDVANLDILKEIEMKPRTLLSLTGIQIDFQNKYAALTKCNKYINILTYNFVSHDMFIGKAVNMESESQWDTYALKADPQGNTFVAGCFSNDCNPISTVCVWDSLEDTTRIMTLTTQGFRAPTAMAVHPNWTRCFVGWPQGTFTLVDLGGMVELQIFPSVGEAISQMMILNNEASLLTFEVHNTVKIWDMSMLLDVSQQEDRSLGAGPQVTHAMSGGSKRPEETPGDNETPRDNYKSLEDIRGASLPNAVQCLSFDIQENRVCIASANSRQGPKCFNLSDGVLCYDDSMDLETVTREANVKCPYNYELASHGDIAFLEKGVLVYERKRRQCMSIHVIDTSTPRPELMASLGIDDAYLRFITNTPMPGEGDLSICNIYICRGKSVEVYNLPDFTLKKTFPISDINKDIPNMDSRTGKRRLKFQTCALTYDGRYFICTNPTILINEGVHKALDIVDLKTGTSKRYPQPKSLGINTLFDSFYYLFWEENETPCLLAPSFYNQHKRTDNPHYACLLQSVTGDFLSRDHQFGVEINNKRHSLNWWRVDPLEKLHVLRGHAMQVTAVGISPDNQFLASGSNDKTVRVWNTCSGHQVASFYFDGGVSGVKCDPLMQYICARYTTSSRSHRLAVLRLRKSKRQISRRDTKSFWTIS